MKTSSTQKLILDHNLRCILIGCLLFAFNVLPSYAVLVTIEPDNYAENTILNNISPHVSLITAGANNLAIPFDVTAKEDIFNAPTGTKVYAHAGVGFWNSDRRLLMTFSSPIDSVSIDFAGGTHFAFEVGYLDAFDVNKTFLYRYSTAPLQYGEIERMSVFGAGIAYAVAYIPPGLGSFGRLDNLAFNVIPEPSVIFLLGISLVLYGFLRRKNKSNNAIHRMATRVTLPASRYAPEQEARHG
jgi:hypothetical protein